MQKYQRICTRYIYQSCRMFATVKGEPEHAAQVKAGSALGPEDRRPDEQRNDKDGGTGNLNNTNDSNETPKYNPIEFEIFKFPHERDALLHGYTLQELYGSKYGLKHSPAVRQEISKDNIMIWIALGGVFTLAILSRNKDHQDTQAWKEYYYHDLTHVRTQNVQANQE